MADGRWLMADDCYSLFAIRHLLFAIRHSLFAIRRFALRAAFRIAEFGDVLGTHRVD